MKVEWEKKGNNCAPSTAQHANYNSLMTTQKPKLGE